MKIEKLSKDNIKEFIKDMKIVEADELEQNVNKCELYGVKKDDMFCLGFSSMNQLDTIAILFYNSKLSNDVFYEVVDFLIKSLVVENHLIIDVYDDKYMKLLDEKYKCRDLTMSLVLTGNLKEKESIFGNNLLLKEKYVDIEMRTIKYFASKNEIICDLVKQNIQDEKIIIDLHNSFVNLNVEYVNFTVFSDNLEYFNQLGYTCTCKRYIIK